PDNHPGKIRAFALEGTFGTGRGGRPCRPGHPAPDYLEDHHGNAPAHPAASRKPDRRNGKITPGTHSVRECYYVTCLHRFSFRPLPDFLPHRFRCPAIRDHEGLCDKGPLNTGMDDDYSESGTP